MTGVLVFCSSMHLHVDRLVETGNLGILSRMKAQELYNDIELMLDAMTVSFWVC